MLAFFVAGVATVLLPVACERAVTAWVSKSSGDGETSNNQGVYSSRERPEWDMTPLPSAPPPPPAYTDEF